MQLAIWSLYLAFHDFAFKFPDYLFSMNNFVPVNSLWLLIYTGNMQTQFNRQICVLLLSIKCSVAPPYVYELGGEGVARGAAAPSATEIM